ncbi:MFS transporter [Candidatus Solirubrobacter pratensis]|uniref:MFS transporter n=1 Tax=Candidatus Solirubrobacter pratensis TaxID=1298857 RepID=UPI001E5EBF45|nr:MFS transporter [Candidatus Solirubrobacter pratensis]
MRPFGRLLGSYTLNELGDSIGLVALAVLVFDRTEAVAPTAGFFLAAKFLPALIAPALTAHLDRFELRRALPGLYVTEAAAFAGLALFASGDRFVLAPVLALGLIDGMLAITGRGLTRGAVAAVLQPRDLLGAGNALMNLGFAISSVFGAALGGLLIAEIGVSAALLVDAASFLIIAAVMAATRDLPSARAESDQERWLDRFRDGLAYARGSVRTRVLLTGQSLALICFTLVVPIEVIYAKESLGTTSAGFGVLLAAWGAGILLGSLLFLGLRNRSGFGLLLVSSGAVGLAYLGMASAQTLMVACLMSVIGGAGNGVQWIAVMTALQESTPPEYQARVSGLLESIGAAMPGVGFLVGAVIVELSSPRTAYTIAGAGVIVLVLVAACLRPAYQRGVRVGGGGPGGTESVALTPRRRPAAPSDGA